MASQPTLQEKQRAFYNEEVGNFVFTAEYPGAETARSGELIVTKPGIKLHFLRHGLFDINATEPTLDVEAEKEEEYKPMQVTKDGSILLDEVVITDYPRYPDMQNHYYAETALRQGYIYIFFENDDSLWLEYEVILGGGLRPVFWKEGSDTKGNDGYFDYRPSDNRIIDSGITFKECEVLWIAYSATQWSVGYHKKMRTDHQERSKRMQQITCSGFTDGQEIDYARSYDQVEAVFTVQEKTEAQWMQHKLEQVQLEDTQPDFKEDMFIILDDPLGWAEDISIGLKNEYTRLDSLIESIQTGQDDKAIFRRLQKGEFRTESLTDYEKQIHALFSMSLTTYQLLYNDPEMEEEYGDTTDKDKLIRILGVKERKQQRAVILEMRDDLGNCLSHHMYQNTLKDFWKNTPVRMFDGKEIDSDHLSLLALHPQDKDRQFNLQKEYRNKDDRWASYFGDILCKKEGLITPYLLETVTDFQDISDNRFNAKGHHKIDRRFLKSMKSILDAFAKYANQETTFTTTLSYLKSFTVAGHTVYQYKKNEVNPTLRKLNFGINTKKAELVNPRKGSVFARITTNDTPDVIEEVITNKKLKLEVKRMPSKLAGRVEKLLAHPKFRVFITGLELVNVSVKLNAISNDYNVKNTINMLGAIANLTSASRSYQEAILKSKGVDILSESQIHLTKAGKISGFIGSGVTVVMCVWDGIEGIQNRDYDAAIVWFATGAIAAALLANSIGVFLVEIKVIQSATFSLASWQIIALNILFFGGVFLALYYSDTPLQTFLKNNILGSGTKIKFPKNTPYQFTNQLYNRRKVLIKNKFASWRDFEEASKDLYDLLVSYRVEKQVMQLSEKIDKEKKEKSWIDQIRSAMAVSAGIQYSKSKILDINVNLRKFLYNESEFHFKLLLLPHGIGNNENKAVYPIKVNKITLPDSEIDTLKLSYEFTDDELSKIGRSSEFVFLSKSIINKKLEEYWPSQRGVERWHAYKFSAVNSQNPLHDIPIIEDIRMLFGKNVRIGSEQKVLNPKHWL